MRLPAFDYQAPAHLVEVLSLKASLGQAASILAGGTDLVNRLRQRLVKPEVVVSLKNVAELRTARLEPVHLVLGAGLSLKEALANQVLRAEFKGLAEALEAIGHPACQGQAASLGGNILLETRCLYYNQSAFFRKGHERCFKAGGQVCLALPESKECSSVCLADSAPILLALSAQVKLASAKAERIIPVAQLFTGKGEAPFALQADEVLTEIWLPRPVGNFGSAFEKLRWRPYLDFALVSAAAAVSLNKDRVERLRLTIGGAGPAPLLVEEAGRLLGGQKPTEELVVQAAQAAEAAAAGRIIDNLGATSEYRRRMVRVVASKAIQKALARAARSLS